MWMNQDAARAEAAIPDQAHHAADRRAVIAIRHKVDINTLEKVDASELQMNEIGAVMVETHKPLFFDPYLQNRATGAFILIDPITNETLARGDDHRPGDAGSAAAGAAARRARSSS